MSEDVKEQCRKYTDRRRPSKLRAEEARDSRSDTLMRPFDSLGQEKRMEHVVLGRASAPILRPDYLPSSSSYQFACYYQLQLICIRTTFWVAKSGPTCALLTPRYIVHTMTIMGQSWPHTLQKLTEENLPIMVNNTDLQHSMNSMSAPSHVRLLVQGNSHIKSKRVARFFISFSICSGLMRTYGKRSSDLPHPGILPRVLLI